MADISVFHNQACSQSRGALAILEEQGVSYDVIRYLDGMPLERMVDKADYVGIRPPSGH